MSTSTSSMSTSTKGKNQEVVTIRASSMSTSTSSMSTPSTKGKNKEPIPSDDDDDDAPSGGLITYNMFVVASYDGRCYLLNKDTGYIYWSAPTNGRPLHISYQGEGVDDYLEIKKYDEIYDEEDDDKKEADKKKADEEEADKKKADEEEADKKKPDYYVYNNGMWHFRPDGPKRKLIPAAPAKLLIEHFDKHYGDKATIVSRKESCYLLNHQNGRPQYSCDSFDEVNTNRSWDEYFVIQRVDFFLQRLEPPVWNFECAQIRAWFQRDEGRRIECVVFHAPDVKTYLKACMKFKMNHFPNECPVNNLIMDHKRLSEEKSELKKDNERLEKEVKSQAKNAKKSRMKLSNHIKGTNFYKGKYDNSPAIIEKVENWPQVQKKQIKKTVRMLRESLHHPNFLRFLDWEIDGDQVHFAYEDCTTFLDYIELPSTEYQEMSEQSTKIISGLVSGVCHLHTRELVHTDLSLGNIWINEEGTVKISGVRECKPLTEGKDRRDNLYKAGEAILKYMSKGLYEASPDKTLLMKVDQFQNWGIEGKNEEVWNLLNKLQIVSPERPMQSPKRLCNHMSFLSAPNRLMYFQELGSYLEDAKPESQSLIEALNRLKIVGADDKLVPDWSIKFNSDIMWAMENVPNKNNPSQTTRVSTHTQNPLLSFVLPETRTHIDFHSLPELLSLMELR